MYINLVFCLSYLANNDSDILDIQFVNNAVVKIHNGLLKIAFRIMSKQMFELPWWQ